ncbi:unnamed protein product, partial [Polarella glacialis]
AFWPGPLSIIGPARPVVPPEVTAGTGFVAVRCPAHEVARQLIAAAGVPLAAPSANRFGHISPTLAEHVFEDLGHVAGLRILDGGPCGVGIESTVVKLEVSSTQRRLVLLRRGGIPRERLELFLADCLQRGVWQEPIELESPAPTSGPAAACSKGEEEAQVSPGMLLKHYAPSVRTVLLSPDASAAEAPAPPLPTAAGRSVLIDFASKQSARHAMFFKVFDLCGQGDQAALSGTA